MNYIVSHLCDKLSCDIVYTNIIPYTYTCINKELSNDICSFINTYKQLREFYIYLKLHYLYQHVVEEYLYFYLTIEERLLYDVFFFLRDKIPNKKYFNLEVILENSSYHSAKDYLNLLKRIWLKLSAYERQEYMDNKIGLIKENVIHLWPYL